MKFTEAVTVNLAMGSISGILSALFMLSVISLSEIKDLITIVSVKIFNQQDVIQSLDDFVTVLSVIYGFIFILKLINER